MYISLVLFLLLFFSTRCWATFPQHGPFPLGGCYRILIVSN